MLKERTSYKVRFQLVEKSEVTNPTGTDEISTLVSFLLVIMSN